MSASGGWEAAPGRAAAGAALCAGALGRNQGSTWIPAPGEDYELYYKTGKAGRTWTKVVIPQTMREAEIRSAAGAEGRGRAGKCKY